MMNGALENWISQSSFRLDLLFQGERAETAKTVSHSQVTIKLLTVKLVEQLAVIYPTEACRVNDCH